MMKTTTNNTRQGEVDAEEIARHARIRKSSPAPVCLQQASVLILYIIRVMYGQLHVD